MAKKGTPAVVMSSIAPDMDEEYRVRRATDTLIDYGKVCEDKPLLRKAVRQLKRATRHVTPRGGRR